ASRYGRRNSTSLQAMLVHSIPALQYRHERLLRDVDAPHAFHALFAFFLLFQEFAFARHVAAVAFGGDVLADGLDGFAGDDFAADGGLEGNFKQVSVDFFLEADEQLAAAGFGVVAVDDRRQRVDAIAVHQNVDLHEVADAEADEVVVHRSVPAGRALEAVVKIVNHLGQRHLVDQNHARGADVFGLLVDAAAILAQLHHRPDAVGRQDQVHEDVGLADFLDES